MSKKKKYEDMNQFDMIHSIDNAIDKWMSDGKSSELISSIKKSDLSEFETGDTVSITDAISESISERRRCNVDTDNKSSIKLLNDCLEARQAYKNKLMTASVQDEDGEDDENDEDIAEKLYSEVFHDEDDSDEEDSSQNSLVSDFKGIQIKFNKEFNTITFFDGINSVSVNLSAIPADEKVLNVDNFESLCSLFLWTEITNFYPSAIITSGKFADLCTIGEYDDDKFGFYDNGNADKIIFGYYIDNDSYNEFMDACNTCVDSKTIGGFITMLRNILNNEAFSFRNLSPNYRESLAMLDYYSERTSLFMGTLFADNDTEIADVPHGYIYDVIQVLPFDYHEISSEMNIFTSVASSALFADEVNAESIDIEDDEDDDDDDDEDDEDDEMEEFDDPEDPEIKEDEMIEESSESDIDKILSSSSEDEETPDEDKMTFGGSDDSDEMFTVRRRK